MTFSTKTKKIISNLEKFIINVIKENKISLIVFLLLLFFYPLVVSLWTKFIIKNVLIFASKNYINDIIFIMLISLLFYQLYLKIKKRFYIIKEQLFIPCLFSVFYIALRIKYGSLFLSLELVTYIKYFDFLLLFAISPIIIKIGVSLNKQDKVKKKGKLLLSDDPIQKLKHDIIGWKNKINLIFLDIESIKEQHSVALGIVGKWGAGKTSFMNLLFEKIKNDEEKFIPIKFNTWLGISPESIIHDFFNTLESNIKSQSFDFSKELSKYGSSVLNVYENDFSKRILDNFNLSNDSNLTDNFKKLNDQVHKLNKKIVIFLDDLDRLQPNEVFQVLRLIRNTASFDSFIYIVGYDKDYLIRCLEENKIPFADKYCEKIFLKEYLLLPLDNLDKTKIIKNFLLTSCPEKEKEIKSFFSRMAITKFREPKRLLSPLKDLRDIKRFLNDFKGGYYQIMNEVEFADYFVLKILKFKFTPVYLLLFTNINKFTTIENSHYKYAGRMKLKLIDPKTVGDFSDSYMKSYLIQNFSYTENELEEIEWIISDLFSGFNDNSLSIVYKNNFHKYFKDELNKGELSIDEFQKVFFSNLTFEDIKKYLDKWHNKNKINKTLFYMYKTQITSFKDRNNYENYLKSLFYIGNLQSLSKPILFDRSYLENCIRDYKNEVSTKYYNGNMNDLRKFVLEILYNASIPYSFEMELCQNLYNEHIIKENADQILTKEILKEYLIHCFRQYVNTMSLSIENDFWDVLHNCELKNWVQETPNSYKPVTFYIEEVAEIFRKEILPRFTDEILVTCISPEDWYGNTESENRIGISNFPTNVLGGWKLFAEYISSDDFRNSIINKSEFLPEFIDFCNELIKANQKIPFAFTYLPVIEKLEERKTRWNRS